MATPFDPNPLHPADRVESYEKGYPRVSYFFSRNPRYLHLRRFSALSIRLLLYRQLELVHLEKRLLEMDESNRTSQEKGRSSYHKDFGFALADRVTEKPDKIDESDEFGTLLMTTRKTLKAYEEDLIRFEKLGLKGWQIAKLKDVQKWLEDPQGCEFTLEGLDKKIWGYTEHQLHHMHALDLIQVIEEPESSWVNKHLEDGLSWWPAWTGKWLSLILKGKWKGPSEMDWYSHKSPALRRCSLIIGFVITSSLVYGAITAMYFFSGKAFNIVIIIVVPLLISICELGFTNQKFIAMLATICAVLVTLSANNNEKRQYQPKTSV